MQFEMNNNGDNITHTKKLLHSFLVCRKSTLETDRKRPQNTVKMLSFRIVYNSHRCQFDNISNKYFNKSFGANFVYLQQIEDHALL